MAGKIEIQCRYCYKIFKEYPKKPNIICPNCESTKAEGAFQAMKYIPDQNRDIPVITKFEDTFLKKF